MIEEVFGNGIKKDEILELWPEYYDDLLKIERFASTNIRKANIALNSVLTPEESAFLEIVLLCIVMKYYFPKVFFTCNKNNLQILHCLLTKKLLAEIIKKH